MNAKESSSPASSSNAMTVTLRRTVTIKAVVTDDFRAYLSFECDQATANLQRELGAVDAQYKARYESLKTQHLIKELADLDTQYAQEKARIQGMMREWQLRKEQSAQLQTGSLFAQGTVDGYVNVKQGDNLYQKLGAMEIIVKDGIIQEIIPAGTPWQQAPGAGAPPAGSMGAPGIKR